MRRSILAAGTLALALATFAGPAAPGWWDEAAETKTVTLTELTTRPHDHRGTDVRFDCVFHQVSEFYNPYYTRFTPSAWVNFSAWPADAEIWREEVFVASHPFLFLDRADKALETLLAMPRFTRLRLTGVVQEVFRGTAWIEVRAIEVLPETLSRDALSLLVRSERAAARGEHEESLARLREASGSPLPAEVRRSIARMEAASLAKLGRVAEARQTLAAALAANPKDEGIRKDLAALDGVAPPAPVSPAPAPVSPAPAAPVAAPPPPRPEAARVPPRAAPPPAPAPVEAPDGEASPEPPVEAPAATPPPPPRPEPAAPAAPAPPKKRMAGPM